MTKTAHDHPLVRSYLRDLDEALRGLPPAQARELREQITAHIDDELAPDAPDDEITAALRRLGSPADLAAEAGGAGIQAAAPAGPSRQAIARRRRRRLAVLIPVVLVAGLVTGYLVAVLTAQPLVYNGGAGWWYPQDASRVVYSNADGVTQTTVPMRWRQRQGLFVQVYNYSGWTQTVLGFAPGTAQSPGSLYGAQLGISVREYAHGWPGVPTAQRYALPVSIPPGQSRWLRVLWTSDICETSGASIGIDQLTLVVRVGWITRHEVVALGEGWFLSGNNQSSCYS
ncbi:MAG TPA: hypothetical protein VEL03_00395 [Streptosporangiaceae bacterium]|nr:hypothetical protein [Streptosporangiaceae bacterium]